MIIIILVLGLLLRLINLNQSLWLDEAISALAARDLSYFDISFNFLRIDNHPPLFYLLLKFWGSIFGFTDWILRILPVLLGVGVIYTVFKVTQIISKNSREASIAGVLAATSPLLVYYSQEIRMYILITLLAAIQVFIFLGVLNKETRWKWVLFSLLNCLLFFSDYITVFLFPVFLLYPIIKKDKQLFLKILLSFVPLGILFTLWFPVFSDQLNKNKEIVDSFPGWQFIIGGATVKNLAVIWMKFVLGRISFEPKIIYYGLIGIGSVPILVSLFLAARQFKKYLFFWLWLVIPVVLGFLFSFAIPVFNYFRFIFVYPAMLILTAFGIFELKKNMTRKILIAMILLTNLTGLLIYYLDPLQSRENWKQAVDFIESNAAPTDLVVFEFHEPVAPYRWYSTGKVDVIGATDSYFADRQKTNEKLGTSLTGKTKVYHFGYLRDLTDPQKIAEQKLIDEGFKKGEVLNDFKNIGQITIWDKQPGL